MDQCKELLPCPFCGSRKLKIDSKRTHICGKFENGRYVGQKRCAVTIRCMKCFARSPVAGIVMPDGRYNEEELMQDEVSKLWNRRFRGDEEGDAE